MSARQGVWLLGAAASALLALRVAALFISPLELQFDEAQYWSWAQDPAWGYYSKPPLIAWTIAASTAVCGDGEGCVRLAAPLLHMATAVSVGLLVSSLGARGFEAALAGFGYLILPGVALGSFVISTDTVLLPLWTLTLIALWQWRRSGSAGWAVASGLGLGLGLLAKYAMIYLPLCTLVWLVIDPAARRAMLGFQGVAAATLAALIVTPHLAWNASLGWPTMGHTVDNANWQGQGGGILSALEFLAGQALVFGPLLIVAIIGALWVLVRRRMSIGGIGRDEANFLLVMAVPIILIVSAQAGISRAHANWAAPAVIGLTAFAVPVLRKLAPRLLTAAIGLNAVLSLTLLIMVTVGPAPWLPTFTDAIMHRMSGQQALAGRLIGAVGTGDTPIVFDDRETLAAALYYMKQRDTDRFRMAHPANEEPDDHYSLTRPFQGQAARAILVARHPKSTRIAGYRRARAFSTAVIPTVRGRNREISVFQLVRDGS